MKIVIAGDGKVGTSLVRQLSREGHSITVLDNNKMALEASDSRYDVMTVNGNCVTMSALREAQIENADLLIAATSADETNLLCCLTAHRMNPDLHTIARVRNPEYSEQIYAMRDIFALSMTVNPEKQAAREIERILRYPGSVNVETFARGRIDIVELRVEEGSKLCDLTLSDMYRIVRCRVLVCAVLREGEVITPNGTFTLRAGDRIFVTAPTDELSQLLRSIGAITKRSARVIICGGGKIAYYLTSRLLHSGIQVTIMEKNPERCSVLSEMLPQACILEGDASDPHQLEREDLDHCDALIAMTGLDELNVIISLYGKHRGIPKVVTKLGHMSSGGILDNLRLDSVVMPKELCCNTIVQYVRAMDNQNGAAIAVHKIANGKVEASEFRVTEKTRNIGKPLKTMKIRKRVLVVAISHGPETVIPSGDSSFAMGDSVVVVSSDSRVLYDLNDIFE